jgi:AAA domain
MSGDAEPWTYAETRLRTAGRVISSADDKLAALAELAGGFGQDIRDGYLTQTAVVDRLHQLAHAYGLYAKHDNDAIQGAIADGLRQASAPPSEAWGAPARGRINGVKVTIATAAALRIKDFPPIKYIVPSYIPEGCTILAGGPKIGKSWLMLDVGLAVARGGDCLSGIKCDAGSVLYLGLEDNERRLQSRMTRLMGFAGEWPTDFHYATQWPRANDGGLDQIRNWITSADKARLVVIDVLAAMRSPRTDKQSPYEADYGSIQALQKIASDTGVAVVIVHHLRKGGSDGDPVEKVSGTLGLSGAADTFLILDRDGSGATLYGRGRDLEEVDAAVEFDRMTCRWRMLGQSGEVRRTGERGSILGALKEAREPMTPNEISAATLMPNLNVRQLLFKMVKANEVIKTARARYLHPDNTTSPDNDDNEMTSDEPSEETR